MPRRGVRNAGGEGARSCSAGAKRLWLNVRPLRSQLLTHLVTQRLNRSRKMKRPTAGKLLAPATGLLSRPAQHPRPPRRGAQEASAGVLPVLMPGVRHPPAQPHAPARGDVAASGPVDPRHRARGSHLCRDSSGQAGKDPGVAGSSEPPSRDLGPGGGPFSSLL